jgi:hypothetical protein
VTRVGDKVSSSTSAHHGRAGAPLSKPGRQRPGATRSDMPFAPTCKAQFPTAPSQLRIYPLPVPYRLDSSPHRPPSGFASPARTHNAFLTDTHSHTDTTHTCLGTTLAQPTSRSGQSNHVPYLPQSQFSATLAEIESTLAKNMHPRLERPSPHSLSLRHDDPQH